MMGNNSNEISYTEQSPKDNNYKKNGSNKINFKKNRPVVIQRLVIAIILICAASATFLYILVSLLNYGVGYGIYNKFERKQATIDCVTGNYAKRIIKIARKYDPSSDSFKNDTNITKQLEELRNESGIEFAIIKSNGTTAQLFSDIKKTRSTTYDPDEVDRSYRNNIIDYDNTFDNTDGYEESSDNSYDDDLEASESSNNEDNSKSNNDSANSKTKKPIVNIVANESSTNLVAFSNVLDYCNYENTPYTINDIELSYDSNAGLLSLPKKKEYIFSTPKFKKIYTNKYFCRIDRKQSFPYSTYDSFFSLITSTERNSNFGFLRMQKYESQEDFLNNNYWLLINAPYQNYENLPSTSMYRSVNTYVGLWQLKKIWLLLIFVCFGISFVGVCYLAIFVGKDPYTKKMLLIDKVPYFIMLLIYLCILIPCFESLNYLLTFPNYGYSNFGAESILSIFSAEVITCESLIVGISTMKRIRNKQFFRYTLFYSITNFLYNKIEESFTTYAKVSIIEVLITTLETMVIVGFRFYTLDTFILLFSIYKLLELLMVFFIAWQFESLKKIITAISNGNNTSIDTEHLYFGFKMQAVKLQTINNNIKTAVDEKMKSEHMKTELITNVSHDIKTPLTSIINYVDLMKKEEIDNSTVKEYITVLDRQSARLKKLIIDLIEVSKASSGVLNMNLTSCDLNVILGQALAEFSDKFEASKLTIRKNNTLEEHNHVIADGRYLWRVFDNIFSNICKYSIPNSRVYIDVFAKDNFVYVECKNISREELNISPEQLMERFVRGDASRNSSGSGLGLSIAKSLLDLMHGDLSLSIDGDLFKASIKLSVADR